MREGLRSSANLLAKTEKNEVSPSKLTRKYRGLTDEETPKLNQGEALREEMEVGQRDGFKIEEREGGSDMGECNAVETSKSRRKRSRVDREGESEDGGVENKKVKDVVDGEKEVVVRQLRSVTKTERVKVVDRGQQTGGTDGFEKKRVEVKTEESDLHDEDSGKLYNEVTQKLNQKGDGSEKIRIKVAKEESNQYVSKESERPDNEVRENVKPRCGTPPKFQENDLSEKKRKEREEGDHSVGEESDRSHNGASKTLKHKRGRYPKSQKCHRPGKKRGKAGQEGHDLAVGEESEQSGNEVSEKLKPKRGRPPKAKKSDESDKKSVEVVEDDTAESSAGCDLAAGKESERSGNEVSEKLKPKRGRPPKAKKSDESDKKSVEVVEDDTAESSGGCDLAVGEESERPGNEVSEKLKPKRGRPPRAKKSDESDKKSVEVVEEDIAESSGGCDLAVGEESERSGNEVSEKLKPKRGRPPKTKKSDESDKTSAEDDTAEFSGEESDESYGKVGKKLKPKRGRPPKAKKSYGSDKKSVEVVEDDTAESSGEESDESYGKAGKKLKPKRGRPCKLNKAIEVGGLRKRQWGKKTRHNKNHNVGARSALSGGKKSNAMKLATARKIKFSNDEKEEGRNKQKAVVRDKIIELLLGAGWTIEHRPRNGREYCDAVYVNPEGRTHWSVTLAYRVLKKHYEDGGRDSNTCTSGFRFTPLPDDELSILTKVIGKERSDKNKKKKKWKQGKGGKTGEGVAKQKNKKGKLYKRKLDAAATPGCKKLKDRTKCKSSLSEEDDNAGMSDDGTAVKDRRQLKTHNRKRCALMIRNSKEGADSDGDGYMLYNGKRTVLAWMVDLGSVPLDGKVQYLKRRKTRAVLKGKITTDGIQCDCCGETFAISDFESHAGSKSCQPLKNICLENGHSLLLCQLESWNKQDESDHKGFHFVDTDGQDPNDDTCGICGDGGNLICCDSCPSTFHQSCLEIKKFPSGVWNCPYCSCKFCGMDGGDTCQMDENAAAAQPALLSCCLCEEKYHRSCIPAENTVNYDYCNVSFCGKKCQELYDKLQALLGVKHEIEEGFAWTLVRRFDVGSDISLSGMHRKVECNSKVAVALHIMDECFLPMPDHRSGVNLIRNIVYNFGSNFNRLNYSGFLTAILERGDEIISAASIRIHGNQLAEMPFIGTRHMYRRQGMCRRLLSAIETALSSLNVEKLVIPAISELRETWTSVFGFKPLEGSSKQKMRYMKMVAFPGVDMLQKPLLEHHQFTAANMVPAEGSVEVEENHTMDETSSDSDEKCSSMRFDLKGSTETSERKLKGDAQMNQNDVSEVEGKLPSISFIGSEAADYQGQCQFASKEHTEIVPCEVKVEDSSCRQKHDSMHPTSEIVTSPIRHLVSEHKLEVSGTKAVHLESTSCNISYDVVQSKTASSLHKVQDAGKGDCGVLPVDCTISSCQDTEPIAKEMVVLVTVDPNSAVTAKPDLQSCRSNGFCFATELRMSFSGVDMGSVHDLKEPSATVQSDAISPYGGSISDGPQMNVKSPEDAYSVSEVEPASLTESISEPLCNSISAPAVGLHCASGGGNSCGAPEVIILSNQAR